MKLVKKKSFVFFLPLILRIDCFFIFSVCVWQQRSASKLCDSSDDFHPPALQRSISDHHLPLQELCGLQGWEEGQLEESCDSQGLQRSWSKSRGKQPLQIHSSGGLLLSKFPHFKYFILSTTNSMKCPKPRMNKSSPKHTNGCLPLPSSSSSSLLK